MKQLEMEQALEEDRLSSEGGKQESLATGLGTAVLPESGITSNTADPPPTYEEATRPTLPSSSNDRQPPVEPIQASDMTYEHGGDQGQADLDLLFLKRAARAVNDLEMLAFLDGDHLAEKPSEGSFEFQPGKEVDICAQNRSHKTSDRFQTKEMDALQHAETNPAEHWAAKIHPAEHWAAKIHPAELAALVGMHPRPFDHDLPSDRVTPEGYASYTMALAEVSWTAHQAFHKRKVGGHWWSSGTGPV